MEAPKRRFEVEIQVDGDSWVDILGGLDDLVQQMERGLRSSVAGGCSMSYSVRVTESPDMTREKHEEELDKYIEFLDKKKAAGK